MDLYCLQQGSGRGKIVVFFPRFLFKNIEELQSTTTNQR